MRNVQNEFPDWILHTQEPTGGTQFVVGFVDHELNKFLHTQLSQLTYMNWSITTTSTKCSRYSVHNPVHVLNIWQVFDGFIFKHL